MSTKRPKIVLYGAGNIGATVADKLLKSPYDVVLFDVFPYSRGKHLDLDQAAMMRGAEARFSGTNDPRDIADADVVIVTAGSKRTTDMKRDDLLFANAKVMSEVAKNIKQYCPGAFVIVVTNPLDAMVGLLQKVSGLPTNMVVGMAGILDTTRMKYFIREALAPKIHAIHIEATVLGGHGDLMVPVRSLCKVNGMMSIDQLIKEGLLTEADWEQIVQRTRDGGTEVGKVQGTSAYVAPAMAVVEMMELYLSGNPQKVIVPCATYVESLLGVSNLYVGVPCMISSDGARPSEISLNDQERQAFRESAAAVAGLNQKLADAGYFSKAA